MKITHHPLMLVLAAALVSSLTGCKDAFDRLDCTAVCESYKECSDEGLDVSVCTDSCYDAVEGNEILEDDAADCSTCLSDKSCSEIDGDCDTCASIYATFPSPMGMGGAE